MFLKDTDYAALIDPATLDYVINSEATVREQAEKFAQDEITSYLANKYDTAAIFAEPEAEPEEGAEDTRSQIIIMRMVDISLYNLFATQPDRMGMDVRQLRYDNAIDWLNKVAKGIISPDLPIITNTKTGVTQTLVSWGSMKKNNMDY